MSNATKPDEMQMPDRLQIFGRATSSNVQKLLWFCDETGLVYFRHDIGREFGGNREPAYLAMNPNGLVPVIRHGDLTLWESNAILRYLATRFAAAELYPSALAPKARVDQWLDWELGTLAPAIHPVFWGLIRTPPERRDDKAIAAALEKLVDLWAILDTVLAASPFVAGDQLSLADIAMGNSVHRWFAFPITRPELHSLRRWYETLLERPAYRLHVAKPLA